MHMLFGVPVDRVWLQAVVVNKGQNVVELGQESLTLRAGVPANNEQYKRLLDDVQVGDYVLLIGRLLTPAAAKKRKHKVTVHKIKTLTHSTVREKLWQLELELLHSTVYPKLAMLVSSQQTTGAHTAISS